MVELLPLNFEREAIVFFVVSDFKICIDSVILENEFAFERVLG